MALVARIGYIPSSWILTYCTCRPLFWPVLWSFFTGEKNVVFSLTSAKIFFLSARRQITETYYVQHTHVIKPPGIKPAGLMSSVPFTVLHRLFLCFSGFVHPWLTQSRFLKSTLTLFYNYSKPVSLNSYHVWSAIISLGKPFDQSTQPHESLTKAQVSLASWCLTQYLLWTLRYLRVLVCSSVTEQGREFIQSDRWKMDLQGPGRHREESKTKAQQWFSNY